MTSAQQRARCALMTPIVVLIGVMSALALTPTSAGAEIGPELVRFGENGSGAGQLNTLTEGGIATDPTTGHVFVSDSGNDRIDEFTAWGQFVKAWGWGVRDGSAELQTCNEETGCREGLSGAGAGQIFSPSGLTVDPSGNVFVMETIDGLSLQEQRIQKFGPNGEFLLMMGGEVDKTTGANVCTKADLEGGDVCGAGEKGTGPGEFSRWGSGRDNLDIGPDGRLYVADQNRIQFFQLDGAFAGQLPFSAIQASNPLFPVPEASEPEFASLAIDPLSEDFLIDFAEDSSVWRVSHGGAVLNPAPLLSNFKSAPERLYAEAVATDPAGDAYVAVEPASQFGGRSQEPHIRQLDPSGEQIGECCLSPGSASLGRTNLVALATNPVTASGGTDLYVLHHVGNFGGVAHAPEDFIEVRGPAPDKWPPPVVPPDLDAQFASSVRSESATLKAEINPNFWSDTAYQLEYGAADCSGGGCAATPAQPRQLGAGIVKRDVTTDGIALSGLEPGTTYHYRFVVQSGGGGPVHGPDMTFTTYPAPRQTSSACPNQALRTGSSAGLADCRAYEMASPVDKKGADLSTFIQINGLPARLNQGAASGEEVTYSASTAFGDAPGAPYSTQYLSTRGADGWRTRSISPPQDSGSVYTVKDLDSPYKAFSDDLSSGWLVKGSEPPLVPGALAGFGNLYRRDNLSDAYEALSTVEPPAVKAEDFYPTLQGFSADGAHGFFRAKGKLTPDASANPAIEQVYESFGGDLRLIGIRPNGSAATVNSTVGAPKGSLDNGRDANVATAVSEDGRLVYWTEEDPKAGKLYVRVEGAETIAVSGKAAATFWRASPDGEKAIYTEAGALERFDLATRESSTLVVGGVLGVMGASNDLSRIYFASTEVLDEGAVEGRPNLYLHEDGQPPRFIAALMSEESPGANQIDRYPPVALNPLRHFARVSADGLVAIFMSRAALSSNDNTDLASGEADAEVYRYDAGANSLDCLSCLSTGARPQGAELQIALNEGSGYWYASKISGAEFELHAPRVLSEDGDRVYFDSLNRLTLADTNGRQDVYQWEAEGKGECEDANAPGFDAGTGGCVAMISDGRGSSEAEFIDASTDGRDVFFLTSTSLLPQDIGQIDIYDAREDGGFPQPLAPAAQCEGEACQPPVTPPAEPPYASQGYRGPGNPGPDKARKVHKKKTRKKKAHRAKHRSKAHAKKAGGRR